MSKVTEYHLMRILKIVLLTVTAAAFASCGTTDNALREAGHSESYVQGFHDGRHSGMSEEGNSWEHYIRDEESFASDAEYRSGWLTGEMEGTQLQDQAAAFGNAAAGAYQNLEIQKEVEKQTNFEGIAEDAVKGVDTSGLESLQD